MLRVGIGAVRYRVDGFVSVDAGATMLAETNRSKLPGFVTAPIRLPTRSDSTSQLCHNVRVSANVESSAAGSVFIEVVGDAMRTLADAQPIQGNSLRRIAQWPGSEPAPVCERGSPSRSGPAHDGAYCTQCSYEIPGSRCAGEWPEPLRCNATADCRQVDSGTCNGERNVCNATGYCVDPKIMSSMWCRSVNQTAADAAQEKYNDTSLIPVSASATTLSLRVALVAAKLFSIDVACAE